MKQLSSLILLAPLVACSGHSAGTDVSVDAAVADDSGFGIDPPTPVDPDLSCTTQPPPTVAVDPMVLAGQVATVTLAGLSPVADADVKLFKFGEPVVLASTQSHAGGAFSTGNVVTGGHGVHAYLKAAKQDYRTAFFYPPYPFAVNASNLVVPTISDAMFETVKTQLGAMQDDKHNGVLLVAVLDCGNHPVAGATLSVRRGMNQVGHAYDLGTLIPASAGVYLVFNVPDGKVTVGATYGTTVMPEHDVMVRSTDPDCSTPRGTLTSTIVKPGA